MSCSSRERPRSASRRSSEARAIAAMNWVTRRAIRVNRTATAWLIRRFVDREAEFMFVEPSEVHEVEQRDGAIGFDAPGARYSNERGVTSFEQILAERGPDDPALREIARIVHAADVAGALDEAPEAAGLRAISAGFPRVAKDDHETLERAFFVYDALYAALRARRRQPRRFL